MYDLRIWAIIAALVFAIIWVLGKTLDLGILTSLFTVGGAIGFWVAIAALLIFMAYVKFGSGPQ